DERLVALDGDREGGRLPGLAQAAAVQAEREGVDPARQAGRAAALPPRRARSLAAPVRRRRGLGPAMALAPQSELVSVKERARAAQAPRAQRPLSDEPEAGRA